MIFAVSVGIPVGVLAAVKRGSIFDHTAIGLSLTGYSMPIFWWGIMLIMLVSVQLDLTPVAGRVSDMVFLDDSNPLTGFMLIDTWIWGEEGNFIDAVEHLILPSIVLGTIPLAVIVRMTRSSMLEVLGEDYIRTARAKGLPTCTRDPNPRTTQRFTPRCNGYRFTSWRHVSRRYFNRNYFLMLLWVGTLVNRRAATS